MPSKKQLITTRIKILLIISLVLVLVVAGFWIYSAFRPTEPETQYKTISLSNFNYNYKVGSNFYLLNDLALEQRADNSCYTKESSFDTQNIKGAALKLGLGNESKNQRLGVTIWTDANVNDLFSRFIKLDEKNRSISVIYPTGMNSQVIEFANLYDYIQTFFGLPEYEVTLDKNIKISEGNYSVFYKLKHNDRFVYFDLVDEYYMHVIITENKITEVYFYLLPTGWSKSEKLKPFTNLTGEGLFNKYYQMKFISNDTAISNLGQEYVLGIPAQISFKRSEPAYFYFYDTVLSDVLLPTEIVIGDYQDANNVRGTANMLLVNQED